VSAFLCNHKKADTFKYHITKVIITNQDIKVDISGPLRYLLITLKPLRGPSVGVQPPTDAEKSPD
jgi:hypothetical protein